MMRTIALALLLTAGLLLTVGHLAGCSTAAPGVTNKAGAYVAAFDGTPERVTAAARKACEDLKLRDIEHASTAVDGRVTAKTANNDDVRISIERTTDKTSTVSIRVGIVGDRILSIDLLDRIKKNL